MSERSLIGPIFSRSIERNPPILFVSKEFIFRHSIGEIFLCVLVYLDADFFSSINADLRFTKHGIFLGSRCTYPSIHLSFRLRWHSEDHGRLPDEDTSKHSHKNLDHGRLPAVHVSKHVRRNHLVWTPFEAIALSFLHPKKTLFFFTVWEAWAGHVSSSSNSNRMPFRPSPHTRSPSMPR